MEKNIKVKELIRKLINSSNIIHQQSLKGTGNFVVVSTKVAESINNLNPEYRRLIRTQKLDKINESIKNDRFEKT